MPRINLLTIFFTAFLSLLCYHRADLNRYGGRIAQAMNIVDAQYVCPVTTRQLYENAMHGMVESLDPYSAYISPRSYGEFKESLDQEFGGVGIMVELDEATKRLRVVLPLPSTPAYRAGILADDLIMEIDGHDTAAIALDEAVELMRGRPGELVRLSVLHHGDEEPVELNVERAIIPIESVLGDVRRRDGTWDFHLEADPRIVYIRLENFGEKSVEEMEAALAQPDIQAVLLDLRGNAGGLLKAGVEICDMFIERGVIVTTRGRGDEILDAFHATPEIRLAPDVPMAVLIDGDSASAAEILAACLQDHERAVIAGTRSWGKGTVQNVIPMEGGTAALKLTIATYWRPSGQDIHRSQDEGEEDPWGVTPDPGFLVEVGEEELDKVRDARARRDLPASELRRSDPDDEATEAPDRQLGKAVEYLQQQLTPSP